MPKPKADVIDTRLDKIMSGCVKIRLECHELIREIKKIKKYVNR